MKRKAKKKAEVFRIYATSVAKILATDLSDSQSH